MPSRATSSSAEQQFAPSLPRRIRNGSTRWSADAIAQPPDRALDSRAGHPLTAADRSRRSICFRARRSASRDAAVHPRRILARARQGRPFVRRAARSSARASASPSSTTTFVPTSAIAHDRRGMPPQAVAWLWREGRSTACRSRGSFIAGHSAGGHLVAMLLRDRLACATACRSTRFAARRIDQRRFRSRAADPGFVHNADFRSWTIAARRVPYAARHPFARRRRTRRCCWPWASGETSRIQSGNRGCCGSAWPHNRRPATAHGPLFDRRSTITSASCLELGRSERAN